MELIGSVHISFLATITIFTILIYYLVLGRLARPTVKFKEGNTIASKETNTFRVSGVPVDWDSQELQTFLRDQESIKGVVEIESLASENDGRSQMATVTFENTPSQLQHGRRWPIPIPAVSNTNIKPGRKQHLTIDRDFHGITALYTPSPQDYKIDVIALSGLGGHAFGSFKERGGSHMWLRDSLPHDLTLETNNQPIARIMIYGYESTVARSESMQNLEDFATNFNASLQMLANATTTRPIILIGHSLGGLIIKQALISLSRSKNEDDQKLIRAIYGVVFFGTPHHGMDISSLIPMVGDGPNRSLIESLNHYNSQTLTSQHRDFVSALGGEGDSEVFCFYETLRSPTAQKSQSGKWEMSGAKAILVTKSSATHCRPWEDGAEHICAINRSHSDMVKFVPNDPDYLTVRDKIKGLARRAFKGRGRLQTSTSKFLVPYSQNPDFVARSEILHKIKEQFGLSQQQGPVQSRRRVALYGLGGVGKTQIALAYAYWLREAHPDISVFWVHASNTDRFRESYASIAKKCNISGWDDPKADILLLVQAWLKDQAEMQWLMIIDNADDAELFFPNLQERDMLSMENQATQTSNSLARYIPDCNHGSILVTTRNKKAGLKLCANNSPIEIGNMTKSECHNLLQKTLSGQQLSEDETSLLSSRLEHLPLALAQAASFIQENFISIDTYIQLLDESDSTFVDQLSEQFETVGRDSETPHAVTATWIISFEQIKQQEELASDILSFLSLFHFQAIPEDYVKDYYQRNAKQVQGSTSKVLIKALGTLKAFCFISGGEDGSLTMHRLVQLVTRKWLINKGKMNEFTEYAIETMSANYPYGKFETHDTCMRYLPHAKSVLKQDRADLGDKDIIKALLLHNMAGYFTYKGEWKEAEDLRLQVIKISTRVLGAEHPNTLTSMGNLASTYWNQGRWKDAEELEVQVMEISKRVLGAEHPDTVASMGNLASTYWNQGRWKDAEELEVQVMGTSKRVLGAEHPHTLTSMGNLASTYRKQGRWKEAEDLEVQVMEISKRVLGVEHPNTLTSIGNLALTYQDQGRWKEAEDLQIQVMEIQKRVLGAEHPDTLTSTASLAFTWKDLGRLSDAIALMEKCASIRERRLGQGHPDTILSLSTLDKWRSI
ncbi:hypothetical protein M441DRAFT_56598 [Trichoderma asperellum CBS 433.97]|uniref:DUF676 domain-containing protein n=1 Tax=Trichoderma asperellum (strain ATCC 204424 / CBS 433.97 / NBRC 101777) TaxID=1042311 RepID=A0A2T3ZFM3_TRIA4|nr:hypothetical protein M441DRAFT_56598 [Trichoderma asperellum CBS 433.97]PTB43606.1 hypothetical protein M441DRAFT_56598 [Trichoderma asperellum CBS 433.97]